jgi:hypothetical protein
MPKEVDGMMECVMCFDSEGELMAVPCVCNSRVHGECLVPWLVRNGTCPVCRESIMRMDEDEPHLLLPMLDPNFLQVVNTVWQIFFSGTNNTNNIATNTLDVNGFLASLVVMFLNLILPFVFFVSDVSCGVVAMSQLQTNGSISPHLCNVMAATVVLHFLSFVLHLLSLSNARGESVERRMIQLLLVFGVGMLLAVPLSTAKGLDDYGNRGGEVKGAMGDDDNCYMVYLLLTYLLKFLMAVPATFHPRSIWKVNYLCERITFVSIMCGIRNLGDTRILLALTSFTGILTSGASLTL